jgi:hypothetical protein
VNAIGVGAVSQQATGVGAGWQQTVGLGATTQHVVTTQHLGAQRRPNLLPLASAESTVIPITDSIDSAKISRFIFYSK